MPPYTVSRRAVLQGLAGTGVAMLALSVPLAGCGRAPAEPPDFELEWLTPEEFRTVSGVAQVMLPGGAGVPSAADLEVARQADRLLGRLNPDIQSQFRQLLAAFEDLPLLALAMRPFSAREGPDAEAYLRAWQQSPLAPMRQGFAGLERLVSGVYFADPRSWEATGYEGAWVGVRDLGYGIDNQRWLPLVNPHVYARFDA